MYPGSDPNERFRVLGYQWRVLRFNDDTRQSTVKIMATYRESEPHSVRFMQQANCLAVPCKASHFFLARFPLLLSFLKHWLLSLVSVSILKV